MSGKLSPVGTICMKWQNLFSGKIKENLSNLLSAELAQSLVKVKVYVASLKKLLIFGCP